MRVVIDRDIGIELPAKQQSTIKASPTGGLARSLVSKVKAAPINGLVAFAEGTASWLCLLKSIRIANSLVFTSRALIRRASKASTVDSTLILESVSFGRASNLAIKNSKSTSSLIHGIAGRDSIYVLGWEPLSGHIIKALAFII